MVSSVDASILKFSAECKSIVTSFESQVHDRSPVVPVRFYIETLIISAFYPFVQFEIILALKIKCCLVRKFSFFPVKTTLDPVVIEMAVLAVGSLDFFSFAPFVSVQVIG